MPTHPGCTRLVAGLLAAGVAGAEAALPVSHTEFGTAANIAAADQCSMHLYNNTSCTHEAFHWTKEADPAGCCATCAALAGCTAWEWFGPQVPPVGTHPNCHLKAKAGPPQRKQGVTCGSVDPVPPLTPAPAPAPPPPPAPPAAPGSPNIVWFLTDDQDQKLGGSFPMHNGVGPMPKTQAALADKGATALNWFIHTPICCPSRSELVTGRYFHNLKATEGGCMHINETLVNDATFALDLHDAGYTVGMFGKYLNNNPASPPPGIDAYMTNGGGEYHGPQFDTKGVSDLAPYFMKDGGWQGNSSDYTTAVVGNVSMSWLRKVAHGPKPFFAYIAPKACHEPFTPADWYADYWDPSWPATEPRPVSWNSTKEQRADHHGVIASNGLITEECAEYVTTSFKNRWRSLMSVDDVIHEVVTFVEQEGLDNNTYFLFSSDHGFQLGEFNLLIDKRQVYDHDVRIHNLVRGPGIAAGSTFAYLGTNVDQAPTWLGLAGLPTPARMDGRSYVPLLVSGDDETVPAQTRKHIKAAAPDGQAAYQAAWRDSVFIEYYYNAANVKCNDYPTESPANNFIGIRHVDPEGDFGDTLYVEYETGEQSATDEVDFSRVDFVEYYNLTADLWQMDNLHNDSSTTTAQVKLSTKMRRWYKCQGTSCL